MNLNKLYYAVGAGLSVMAGSLPMVVHAANNPFGEAGAATTQLGAAGASAGITTTKELPQIIGTIVNVVLGFMGIVLLFYLIYGGFLWMTSGGESKGVDAAKKMIQNAIIGLVIIVSSYAISSFVLSQLVAITG